MVFLRPLRGDLKFPYAPYIGDTCGVAAWIKADGKDDLIWRDLVLAGLYCVRNSHMDYIEPVVVILRRRTVCVIV